MHGQIFSTFFSYTMSKQNRANLQPFDLSFLFIDGCKLKGMKL